MHDSPIPGGGWPDLPSSNGSTGSATVDVETLSAQLSSSRRERDRLRDRLREEIAENRFLRVQLGALSRELRNVTKELDEMRADVYGALDESMPPPFLTLEISDSIHQLLGLPWRLGDRIVDWTCDSIRAWAFKYGTRVDEDALRPARLDARCASPRASRPTTPTWTRTCRRSR